MNTPDHAHPRPCFSGWRLAVVIFSLLLSGGSASSQEQITTVGPPDDLPINVHLNAFLIDVNAIDEIENTFTTHVALTTTWTDPRLAYDPPADGPASRMFTGPSAKAKLQQIWWPEVAGYNIVGLPTWFHQTLAIWPDGRVVLRARIGARFKSPLNFRAFPFDHQVLCMFARSFSWDAQTIRIAPDSTISVSPDIHLPEWIITGTVTAFEDDQAENDPSPFSAVNAHVTLQRKAPFYIWKVLLPLIVIVAVSFSVFWMSDERMARRAGISSTSLLTVVAYQFLISESLPRVAYLTTMDLIMLISFIITAGTMVVNVLGATPAWVGTQRIADTDRLCRWLFPVIYVAAMGMLIVRHAML